MWKMAAGRSPSEASDATQKATCTSSSSIAMSIFSSSWPVDIGPLSIGGDVTWVMWGRQVIEAGGVWRFGHQMRTVAARERLPRSDSEERRRN